MLLHALRHHAAGAITALTNLAAPLLRAAWKAFRDDRPEEAQRLQARLDALRDVLETFPTFPAAVKALGVSFGWPKWGVKSPLREPDALWVQQAMSTFQRIIDA